MKMPYARKYSIAIWGLSGLLAAAGCGSKDAAGPDGTAAAINVPGAAPAEAGGSTRQPGAPRILANPVVAIQTSLGEIVVELNAQAAPRATDRFLYHTSNKHYDGTVFHQVIKNQAIVGGQYQSDFASRPARTPIPNEARSCGLHNDRYTIAMMRDPDIVDSADCQFFINLNDNRALDHKGISPPEFGYCPFGKVIEGFDVIEKIAQRPVKNVVNKKDGRSFEDWPEDPVIIQKVTAR